MKILLVTKTDKLAEKLAVLNPALDYCAIVTDAVEPAKEVLRRVGLSQDLLLPLDNLKTCVEGLDYDYLLCLQSHFYDGKIMNEIKSYAVSKDKVLGLAFLHNTANFQIERSLRYYEEHSLEFEMFATGISHTAHALDIKQFNRKLINLAKPSQDLYYDFRIAKRIVSCGRGHSKFGYALIGLVPYSFHYDLSLVFRYRCLFLPYFIALNDLHNLPVPASIYKKFFRENYLAQKTSLTLFHINNPYNVPIIQSVVSKEKIIAGTNTWKNISPETRDENIKILDDYLTLCEENNIRPIMFTVPVTENYKTDFNKSLLEEFYVLVEQARQKHPNALFVDGWQLPGFTYEYFFDLEHLNPKGAAKFSTYLSNVIEGLERQGR